MHYSRHVDRWRTDSRLGRVPPRYPPLGPGTGRPRRQGRSLQGAAPGIATGTLFPSLFPWRAFLVALTTSPVRSVVPISRATFRFLVSTVVQWASLGAVRVVAITSPRPVDFCFHRYIVTGLTSGADFGQVWEG